ncbi:alpha/beta hydrolase [Aggregatimonas sangjinii]|uniref:Alpha/beta hydrolase n=1 Tax=Aggregatimonas sangjinii TaxID=2583587 RepID=A0A5B7SK57_9FLAO|nr:alpha/beta hydrolase [Aggregatimonas sangjinii]QCW98864.1 alpha/beta hydrolase [Aggregatimonas sangjinii]
MKTKITLIALFIVVAFAKAQNNLNIKNTIEMKTVNFNSEGLNLVGNLYLPTNFDDTKTYPAIIVDGSWTTVKEQMQGLYAAQLTKNGFITLAFDHRYFGESEGQPREFENHADKVEDIKNAVTYLQTIPYVDNERIGGVGVCASGAYMMQATAEDKRIKALGTVVAWLMTPETAKLFYGGDEGTNARIQKAQNAKKDFATTGDIAYVPAYEPENMEAAMFFPVEYYALESRGAIAPWTNNFAVMSWEPWLTYDGIASSNDVTVPTIMIGSEKQFLPDGAKTAFENIRNDKKRAVWMDEYQHDQFYDNEEVIEKSVTELARHFRANL